MCCDDIESGFEHCSGDLFNRKRLVRRVGAWDDSPAERTGGKKRRDAAGGEIGGVLLMKIHLRLIAVIAPFPQLLGSVGRHFEI